MAIERNSTDQRWRYRINEYNNRQIMRQRAGTNRHWEKCGDSYATAEEASAALSLLLKGKEGEETGQEGS
jgi:hypothetical protein